MERTWRCNTFEVIKLLFVVAFMLQHAATCKIGQVLNIKNGNKTCLDCPKCKPGYGLNYNCHSEKPVYGEIEVKCIPCFLGIKFSKGGWDLCEDCRKCDGTNEHLIVKCLRYRNSECDCVIGYYRDIHDVCNQRCCPCTGQNTKEPQCAGMSDGLLCQANVTTGKCTNVSSPTINPTNPPKTSAKSKNDVILKVSISLSVILVLIVLVVLLLNKLVLIHSVPTYDNYEDYTLRNILSGGILRDTIGWKLDSQQRQKKNLKKLKNIIFTSAKKNYKVNVNKLDFDAIRTYQVLLQVMETALPSFKLSEFLRALHQIGRSDVVNVLLDEAKRQQSDNNACNNFVKVSIEV